MTQISKPQARALVSTLRHAMMAVGESVCLLPCGTEVEVLALVERDRRDVNVSRELVLGVDTPSDPLRQLVVRLAGPSLLVRVPLEDVTRTPVGVRVSFVAAEAQVEVDAPMPRLGPCEALVITSNGERRQGVCTTALCLGDDWVMSLALDAPVGPWEDAQISLAGSLHEPLRDGPQFVAGEALSTGGGRVRIRARRVDEMSVAPEMCPSCIELADGARIPLRRVGERGEWTVAEVEMLTTSGFVGRLSVPAEAVPPRVEVDGREIRFRCMPHDDEAYRFELWSDEMGDRVRWYGYLCRLAGLTTTLRPEDAADLALLLHETGYHSEDVMRDRLLLAPRDAAAYEAERALPRTHVRLAGRTLSGRIGGHCLLARTSDRLWSACDVVRNGLYPGRWNLEGVAPWLRAMGELLGVDSEALIQWTFLSGGGVWDAFAQQVSESSALVPSLQSAWIATADRSSSGTPTNPFIWRHEASSAALEAILRNVPEAYPFFEALHDWSPRGPFARDYAHEHGLRPLRRLYRVTSEDADLIVDIGSYAPWVGLNGGHDLVHVVNLNGAAPLSVDSGRALMNRIAELRLDAGGLFSPTTVLQFGVGPVVSGSKEAINLQLRPEGLQMAAAFAEGGA